MSLQHYTTEAGRGGRREGLGSAEATEMVLNNLFYITAKVKTIFVLFLLTQFSQITEPSGDSHKFKYPIFYT